MAGRAPVVADPCSLRAVRMSPHDWLPGKRIARQGTREVRMTDQTPGKPPADTSWLVTTDPTPAPPDPNTSSTEPLVTVATVTTLTAAGLGLAVTFGLHLAPNQQAAILGVVGVLAPVVVAAWGRRRVYSPATVARLLAATRARKTVT